MHENHHVELANKNNIESAIKDILKRAQESFKKIHDKGSYSAEDIIEHKPLIEATYKALSKSLTLEDGVMPTSMRAALENDIYIFSSLRTHAQLYEASRLLSDENGKLKSFEIFANDFKKINAKYNEDYLQAEYQFAVSSATMAGRWSAIEADGDNYNLQYRTAGDDRVRDSHAAIDLVTLPPSDAFWNSYYPPNGWRCRCNAVQVRKSKFETSDPADAQVKAEKATTRIDKDGKNRLEIFRFNPGKQKVIFPPHHPYRKVQHANRILEIERSGELDFDVDKRYKGPGTIRVHKNVNPNGSDYETVYKTANNFADQGKSVDILPKFHSTPNPEYDKVFGKLKATQYYGRCPDLRVNGVFIEHEGFNSTNAKNAFRNMMNHGLKQSSYIVIEDPSLSERYIKRSIIGRIDSGQNINAVWINTNNSMTLIYKNTEAQQP